MKKKSKQKLVSLEDQSEENSKHSDSDVRPNDYLVLDVLDEKSEYSFSGIMRKLGMHQETLSRSLHRLHDLGIIDKSESGYKISNKTQGLPKNEAKQAYAPILLSYLPPKIGSKRIIREIAGKWFKNLRWIGVSEDNGQKTLQWIRQNGLFYINLKVFPNYIVIETNAENDNDKADAISGAYGIIQKITNLSEAPLATSLTN